MENQFITNNKTSTPLQIVRRMGALQAQDYEAALWAIGLRCGGKTTVSDVQLALENAEIVRTWLFRGTLHIGAHEDVRWMIEPCSARLNRTAVLRDQKLGLSQDMIEKTKSVLVDALKGRKILTRTEMYEIFERNGVPSTNNLGYHMLYRASWDGLICFGPQKGKEQTFVLLDEWVKKLRICPEEDVLKELAVRYFEGHGPATISDFAWWTGIKMPEAREGIEKATRLIAEEVDGKTYYSFREKSTVKFEDGKTVLLPAFDEYVLGYTDRTQLADNGKSKEAKLVHSNGVFLPTILSEGKIIGTWKKQKKGNVMKIYIEPFDLVHKHLLSDLKEATESYGNFLEMETRMEIWS